MGEEARPRRFSRLALAAALMMLATAGAPYPVAAEDGSAPFAGAAAAQMRFRAIKVDVSALAANGLAPEAAWLAQDLPARLDAAFGARLAPRDGAAPILVARIDLVRLGASGEGGAEPLGASGARDGIQGVGLVVAPNGRTIAAFPLYTSQIAFTGGSVYEPGTERRRVAELAAMFAQWLPGQMGL
jgi:hypothetical protein